MIMLVDVDQLRTFYQQDNGNNLRVFDCRFRLSDSAYGSRAYGSGHLPGALFLDLERDLSGSKTGSNGRHPLPEHELFMRLVRHSGIGPQTRVVIYDDGDAMMAARLWWMLHRWLGHAPVAILDGGFAAWQRCGLPLSTETPVFAPTDYPLIDAASAGATYVGVDAVLSNLDEPRWLLMDARSPDRFAGENETMDPAGGHIPGAINRFFRLNLDARDRFKSPEQLRQEFLVLLGDVEPQHVVHQCGSGVTACHNLFAMEYAELHGSRLYPGSWSEWCADARRPMATA